MSTHTLATLLVVASMIMLLACWAVLFFFVAPMAFPKLTAAFMERLGIKKKGSADSLEH